MDDTHEVDRAGMVAMSSYRLRPRIGGVAYYKVPVEFLVYLSQRDVIRSYRYSSVGLSRAKYNQMDLSPLILLCDKAIKNTYITEL